MLYICVLYLKNMGWATFWAIFRGHCFIPTTSGHQWTSEGGRRFAAENFGDEDDDGHGGEEGQEEEDGQEVADLQVPDGVSWSTNLTTMNTGICG
jgi:hypothetical protein